MLLITISRISSHKNVFFIANFTKNAEHCCQIRWIIPFYVISQCYSAICYTGFSRTFASTRIQYFFNVTQFKTMVIIIVVIVSIRMLLYYWFTKINNSEIFIKKSIPCIHLDHLKHLQMF